MFSSVSFITIVDDGMIDSALYEYYLVCNYRACTNSTTIASDTLSIKM